MLTTLTSWMKECSSRESSNNQQGCSELKTITSVWKNSLRVVFSGDPDLVLSIASSMTIYLKYIVSLCINVLCLLLPGDMRIISFRNSGSTATAEVNFVFKIGIRALSCLGVPSPVFLHSLAMYKKERFENRQIQILNS